MNKLLSKRLLKANQCSPAMMISGVLLCILAAWHHRRTTHEMEQGKVKPTYALVIFVGGLVTVLAAMMIIYLVLSAR